MSSFLTENESAIFTKYPITVRQEKSEKQPLDFRAVLTRNDSLSRNRSLTTYSLFLTRFNSHLYTTFVLLIMSDFRPQQFNLLPPAVKNIIIINVLLLLATVVFSSVYQLDITKWLGLYFPGNSNFGVWQYFTYMFMHGGITHLFMNMLSFYMFGSVLENIWGTKRFVFFYFFTGIGAALCYQAIMFWDAYTINQAIDMFLRHPSPQGLDLLFKNAKIADNTSVPSQTYSLIASWNKDPSNPTFLQDALHLIQGYKSNLYQIDRRFASSMVGASGAVFGILLAFGYLFPNTIIYFQLFIPIKAKYFVLFYGLLELYLTWNNNPGDNVAHLAHLGGMLFGFILVYYWNKTRKNTLY